MRIFRILALLLVAGTALAQAPSDLETLKAKAAAGDPAAQNSLGVRYRLGDGVERNKEESVRWFHAAAVQGNAKAMYNLGTAYYNGDGVAINDSISLRWFLLAQEFGDTQAADAVARAIAELDIGRRQEAYFQVAQMFDQGTEIKQDLPRATRFYEKAAQLDYAPAQVMLAIAYLDGRGVPEDDAVAGQWADRAQRSKNAWGAFLMGVMYQMGKGKPRDVGEAIKWYKKAVDGGVAPAMTNLGVIYSKPEGVKQDYMSADFYFSLADRFQYALGTRGRRVVEANLTPAQIADNQKKVDKWLSTHAFSTPILIRDANATRHR